VKLVKSVDESDFVRGLQDEARQHRLPIQVGVHEPGANANKVKNTLLWIDQNGEILQRYQKVHLFDVDIKGGPVLKESEYVPNFCAHTG
jgi:predicted amidohydrolase